MKTKSNFILIAAISILIVLVFFYNLRKTNYFEFASDQFKSRVTSKSLEDTNTVNLLNRNAFDLRLTNPEKTVLTADSALKIAKGIDYSTGIGEAFRVKGVGYSYLNNTELAVKNYIEALNYFIKTNDLSRQARVYNNIGILYKQIDLSKAHYYLNKALHIAKKSSETELMAGLYFNLSEIYRKKNDFKNSLDFIEKSNTIFTRLRDTTYIIIYFQNSGLIYCGLKKFETAEYYLLEAIRQAKQKKLYKVLVGSYLPLVSVYLEQRKFDKAYNSVQEGLKYASMLKDSTSINYLLYKDYEINERLKRYSSALNQLKKVYKHDSLLLAKQQSDNIEKTTKYYIHLQKLQEKELIIAKQQNKETIFWWILTIIIALILFAIIAGLVIRYHLKKKREKEKLEINSKINMLEQKALQAFMNPHFIYNILTTIQFFIGIQDSTSANYTLGKFAKLMRRHLEICMNTTITLYEEIQYLDLYLSLEKMRFSNKMEYSIHITPKIDTDNIFIPSMLIQPFIENSLWHGLMPKNNGGSIKVDFKYVNNLLTISIIDNGIGITNSLNTKKNSHTSRGLELIHERVNLLNKLNEKKIHISQNQTGNSGTKVLITIEL